jgi:hypothetical protein
MIAVIVGAVAFAMLVSSYLPHRQEPDEGSPRNP